MQNTIFLLFYIFMKGFIMAPTKSLCAYLSILIIVAGSMPHYAHADTSHMVPFSAPMDQNTFLYASTVAAPLILFLAYCIFSYNCKSPNKQFKPRYSLTFQELRLRSVRNSHDFVKQIRYIMQNLYWIIQDGIIGIPGNSSRAVSVDPITRKVEAKECSDPAGLFGWLHAYSKAITATALAPYEIGKTTLQVAVGICIWANILKLIPAIKSTIETIATEQGMRQAFETAAKGVLK